MKTTHFYFKITFLIITLTTLFLIEGCQEKPIKISQVKKIKPSKLKSYFKPIALPCIIDNLNVLKLTDSQEFNKNVIQQIFPIKWINLFSDLKSIKHRIYPLRYFEKNDNWYLIFSVHYPLFIKIFVAEFNEDSKMIAVGYINEIGKHKNDDVSQILISKEPTFTSKVFYQAINKPNIKSFAFIEDSLVLILEEYAEIPENQKTTHNPFFDSLKANNPFSADYYFKNNLLQLRDGAQKNDYQFNIEINNDNLNCFDDLQGTLRFANNEAMFTFSKDPCQLSFKIKKNNIIIEEKNQCGAKRHYNCSINGTYTKKKSKNKPNT